MEKILVSACLLGSKVRYNGSDLKAEGDDFAWLLRTQHIVSFCPEVSAGLPTPRAPAEILHGVGEDVMLGKAKVMADDGTEVTQAFMAGAQLALDTCRQKGIRYAVLTESSPSCGRNTIYDGKFNGRKIPGKGVTTALLEAHGIKVYSQHQVGMLRAEFSG
ncbi:DUF523 domain-containing protein [Photobacterium sp. MCCC 1A19761]|uniref:DUF523 domain-containing protein n=1 Tax=Photobacterium sp. MCCC 1A19761 TaxID=3115000 RepID=UPI00307FC68A